jgi:SAM-dependent methyltransferase
MGVTEQESMHTVTPSINPASKSRLTGRQLEHFSGSTLFDRIARAVCRAGTLPAKELFEAWETARRVRRKFRGGRVVDLACGHGLLAHILLLLDDTSPEAVAVDAGIPQNARRLAGKLCNAWPRLNGRIHYREQGIDATPLLQTDLVVSVHACGALTDLVLERAIAARARVAVLPCCHDLDRCDTGGLEGWMDGPLAVDATRAARLHAAGYRVFTRIIPDTITPKNRLLMAQPPAG